MNRKEFRVSKVLQKLYEDDHIKHGSEWGRLEKALKSADLGRKKNIINLINLKAKRAYRHTLSKIKTNPR